MLRRAPVDFSDIEVKREFATSKDGTKVPLSIIHRLGLKLDGSNPTILYGYGGYGLSQTPGFSISRKVCTRFVESSALSTWYEPSAGV